MSTNLESAQQFFESCETGKGWEACKGFCHPDATFASQTTVLSDISSLEGYCEWMKNLFTSVPDGHYELKFFAADEAKNSVAAFAVFQYPNRPGWSGTADWKHGCRRLCVLHGI